MIATNDASPADVVDGLNEPQPRTPREISYLPTRAEINTLIEQANAAAASGFGSPQNCLVKMLFGREAGISSMVALNEIDLIPGKAGVKAALNARTKVALVRRRGLGDVRIVQCGLTGATVTAWRTDDNRRFEFSFQQVDAARAELLHKDNWKKWPQSMYLARAQGLATNALFQEVFLGLAYSADELGAETDEDGRLLTLGPPPATGVIRKAPLEPLTAAVVNASVQEVRAAVVDSRPIVQPETSHAETSPQPDAAPAESLPLIDHSASQRAQLTDQIKLLAGTLLVLTRPEWDAIRPRFLPADRGQEPSLTDLQRLKKYLLALHDLRWMRQELGIPADKWADALRKRGATRDAELSEQAAAELADKLARTVAPFKFADFRNQRAQKVGDSVTANSSENFGGNG